MHTFLKLIVTLGISLLLCYVVKYVYKYARMYYYLQKLPGPPMTGPFIGNLSYLTTDSVCIFRRLRQANADFYPVYKLFAFHRGAANILTPEDCELVLSNPLHNEKGYLYKVTHKWLHSGLLTSTGQKWQTRRRTLTPAFHFNILQQYILVFHEEAEKLVEVLKKNSSATDVQLGSHLKDLTLKTIAETAMGTKLAFETKQEKAYKKAVHEMGQILVYRVTHPWFFEDFLNVFNPQFLKQCRVLKTLHTFTAGLIAERETNFGDLELPKEEHDVYKGKKRLAMLDILLSAKKNEQLIDQAGIQEEVDTFVFEGHDTTAAALGFILMLVANHRSAQECMYEEMTDVLGDPKRKPSYSDLHQFKYMERVIKESLRLYPSVHFISRNLGQDLTLTSGHFLPKHSMVVLHIYDIHRNPNIYPDPEKFDPDRFLPENSLKRHPYAYLPFSAGPRNCIGQKFAMLELKVVLWALLSNFVLEAIDTPQTVEIMVDLILRSKNGIKVKFVPRVAECG